MPSRSWKKKRWPIPNLIDDRTPMAIANGDPKVIIRVIGLGDSAVTLRAWAWARDFPSAFVMKCELLESIKKRFDAEGVEIPFPAPDAGV